MSETCLDCGVDVAQPDVVLLNYADGSHFFVHSLLGLTKRQVRAQLTRKADPHGNPLLGRRIDVQWVRRLLTLDIAILPRLQVFLLRQEEDLLLQKALERLWLPVRLDP